jgi:hypothetical protein
VFELGLESPASEHREERRQSLAFDEQQELAQLAAAAPQLSSALGRFLMQLDSCSSFPRSDEVGSSSHPSPRSQPLLFLSWPVDIAIMSGAQDLHLALSFAPVAYAGRLSSFTLTVLHSSNAKERKKTQNGRGRELLRGEREENNRKDSKPPLHLLYSLNYAPQHWFITGKQSHSFTLADGEQKSFTVKLLPTAIGYIGIPQVEPRARDGI